MHVVKHIHATFNQWEPRNIGADVVHTMLYTTPFPALLIGLRAKHFLSKAQAQVTRTESEHLLPPTSHHVCALPYVPGRVHRRDNTRL